MSSYYCHSCSRTVSRDTAIACTRIGCDAHFNVEKDRKAELRRAQAGSAGHIAICGCSYCQFLRAGAKA